MRKFQIGTPECGLLMGYFIGAVANKGEAVKNVVNKVFPPKDE